MTGEVLLTVTGVQTASDGSEEKSEIRTNALCRMEEGIIFLEYEDEDVPCILSLEEDRIVMRRGESEMVMAAGEETACEYETPYGIIPMKIFTQRIAVRRSPRSIHARAHYRLVMEPDYKVQSMVTVRVEQPPLTGEGNRDSGGRVILSE